MDFIIVFGSALPLLFLAGLVITKWEEKQNSSDFLKERERASDTQLSYGHGTKSLAKH